MTTAAERIAAVKGHLKPHRRLADLQGQVAILTGCNSPHGIGYATARLFSARQPRALVISDIDAGHLPRLARECVADSAGATTVVVQQFDASNEADVRRVISETVAAFGRLDVFFANAGIVSTRAIGDTDEAHLARVFAVNVYSVMWAIKHASTAMGVTSPGKPAAGGSIVCTSSVAGLRHGAGSIAYSSSKAAVISMVQVAAYQLAGQNIRVNAIGPGLIETGMTVETFAAARRRGTEHKIGQLNPLRRYGLAEEIASVVLLLASEEGSYVNGQIWAVDGGLSASLPNIPGKMA